MNRNQKNHKKPKEPLNDSLGGLEGEGSERCGLMEPVVKGMGPSVQESGMHEPVSEIEIHVMQE